MVNVDLSQQEEVVVLKGRELIYIEPHQHSFSARHIGVSLSNEEAQEYVKRDWRVFGDADGPYLVLRVDRPELNLRTVVYYAQGDVKFCPVRWRLGEESGVICYLRDVA